MSGVSNDDIRWLIELTVSEGLAELEVSGPDYSVLIRRHGAPAPAHTHHAPAHVSPGPPERTGLIPVTAPMAGIFYRAASARAEPFVKAGDRVEVGQTVGLVEAMKTFNEVAAEFAGRVIEFRVEDAEAVQRGQPILALEPMEGEV